MLHICKALPREQPHIGCQNPALPISGRISLKSVANSPMTKLVFRRRALCSDVVNPPRSVLLQLPLWTVLRKLIGSENSFSL